MTEQILERLININITLWFICLAVVYIAVRISLRDKS